MDKKPTTVFIVGNSYAVSKMFADKNYDVLEGKNPEAPDIVCFTGGADIDPKLYKQTKLPYTVGVDKDRDIREKAIFQRYPQALKVGICRGAQLLNVLSGGNMYQHVDNHTNRSHPCLDLLNN
jgi:gamma-glutamyl-gamma-aminobutyrate hydrolase PuuD